MRQLILIVWMLILTSIDTHSQNYDVPSGFKWTDKKEYLYIAKSKDLAIDKCKEVFNMHSDMDIDNVSVYEGSKVPVFWYTIDKMNKKLVTIIYCIEYGDGYDVVVKQIKNKDTYFFSIEENDGEVIDLFYVKQ